jgi:hypothetical protein
VFNLKTLAFKTKEGSQQPRLITSIKRGLWVK